MIREIHKQKELTTQFSLQDDNMRTNPYFQISLINRLRLEKLINDIATGQTETEKFPDNETIVNYYTV
ncbi:Oidioi.mRNA.OKI2018_I69.chr2.g5766.t1.cds [Oikopleura dioica]|uniref:Oidioi.mRNA.OKI2018_I69.chr2.g5766.t1.cds n=1 Tax=Oikopleura dioica TaxID=34765 RepID=A0ABN7T5Q5_OIKDI|nr:Oidioi.mRNA.OKI2018_I69.chr2.g5766.t1.cds [Oikopleura dioica]